MKPLHLFDLAAAQGQWLATRQALVSQNVANANTPGYRAVDLEPFEQVLDAAGLKLATTHLRHMTGGEGTAAHGYSVVESEGDANLTGNTVSLEREFANSGRIKSRYALSTSVTGAFHRMLRRATRG